MNCVNLTEINLNEGIASIDDYAFRGCTSLPSLNAPESIESIGTNALNDCPNLTVFGAKDSYTETYCADNSIPFVAYDDIASIAVTQIPTAKQYVGNKLNTTGLVATATLNNGSTVEIYSGYTVDTEKLTDAGEKTIKLTYCGKETTFNVNVIGISSITINSTPIKTTYYVGDELDCSGLTFRVVYLDGTSDIKNSDFTTSVTTFTKSGEQVIRVYYYNSTSFFKAYANPVDVAKVEVETIPAKTAYYVGDTVNTEGLTLKVTYTNGKTAIIDNGYTVITKLNSADIKSVEVEYGGKKTSFEVNVTAVVMTSWSLTSEPTKLEYSVGDNLNTAGLVITEYYNNGTSKEITSGFTCTPDKFTEIGEQIVTVSYKDSTAMFVVNVSEKTHEHAYTSTVTKEPTCTESGVRTYTCECEDTYQETIDALGHDFGEWEVTTPATCTSKGVETRYCSRCDATETRDIEKISHSYTAVVTNPTCTEQGYTTYTCECGDSYVDDYVDALGHDYKAVVTAPTCTEQGFTTYTCSRCMDSYIADYTPAKGHTDGEWKVTKQPTLTEEGEKTLYCKECGQVVKTEAIPRLTHGQVHSISVNDISLNYKSSKTLVPTVEVDEGVNYTVTYSSSNPKVATVDENGKVTATKKGSGSATITCTVTDEYGNIVSDTCKVNVTYAWWQWIIVIVLFGWIWY